MIVAELGQTANELYRELSRGGGYKSNLADDMYESSPGINAQEQITKQEIVNEILGRGYKIEYPVTPPPTVSRLQVIQDAVTKSLQKNGYQPFPTNTFYIGTGDFSILSEDARKIGDDTIAQYKLAMDPIQKVEIDQELNTRGYFVSDKEIPPPPPPPPLTRLQIIEGAVTLTLQNNGYEPYPTSTFLINSDKFNILSEGARKLGDDKIAFEHLDMAPIQKIEIDQELNKRGYFVSGGEMPPRPSRKDYGKYLLISAGLSLYLLKDYIK